MFAPAERDAPLDVGFPIAFPTVLVVDLAVADGHRATPHDAGRVAGADLLALVVAVAGARPPEVQRHPSSVHLLLALDMVLTAQAGQRAQADRAHPLQLGRNFRTGLGAY